MGWSPKKVKTARCKNKQTGGDTNPTFHGTHSFAHTNISSFWAFREKLRVSQGRNVLCAKGRPSPPQQGCPSLLWVFPFLRKEGMTSQQLPNCSLACPPAIGEYQCFSGRAALPSWEVAKCRKAPHHCSQGRVDAQLWGGYLRTKAGPPQGGLPASSFPTACLWHWSLFSSALTSTSYSDSLFE